MMHPDTELQFISEEIGYGVVATRFIPMGTITWVQDELDQVYTPREVEAMAPKLKEMVDKYTFRNKDGNYVMCWDLAKYVNHSFNSNCLSTAYDFEIAIRDIQPGEQLTDDYGYLNITEPFEAKDEGLERSTVYPDDLLRYHSESFSVLAVMPAPVRLDRLVEMQVEENLPIYVVPIRTAERRASRRRFPMTPRTAPLTATPRPKIADVAAAAGVSVPTVSKVLNGRADVAGVRSSKPPNRSPRSSTSPRPNRSTPTRPA